MALTVRDYIGYELNVTLALGYSTTSIDLFIAKNGIDITADLADVQTDIDIAITRLIPSLLLSPASISEGGYSVTYDKAVLRQYYDMRCQELGIANQFAANNIRDISNRF